MGLLQERCRQPEIMDQPGLSPEKHEHALVGLSRINFLSATVHSFVRPLLALQKQIGNTPLRILDVACGGGDVALGLQQLAHRRGLDWHVAGCDLSPVAIDHAGRKAARASVGVDYFVHDALAAPPGEPFDAVICSLFLHHLDNDQAVRMLELFRQTPGVRMILVSDLERSLIGLVLAHAVGRLLTTSKVVQIDGPLSVKAAFTVSEAATIAERAGLMGCTIKRTWPWRWFLTWRAP